MQKNPSNKKHLLRFLTIFFVCGLSLSGCTKSASVTTITPPSEATLNTVVKNSSSVKDNPSQQSVVAAFQMFQATCQAKPWKKALNSHYSDYIQAWQQVCNKAQKAHSIDALFAETFFTQNFRRQTLAESGLFTGYFAAKIQIQKHKDATYRFPVHGYADRISKYSRAEIAANPNHAPILFYTNDAIDLFLLHVQGSGVGILPSGTRVPIGYAGNNGHQYQSIGRKMIAQNILAKGKVTWPKIDDWLRQQDTATRLTMLHKNPRYIYFHSKGKLPTGSLGVELIPEAALAIDPKFLPLGLPVWLDAAPIINNQQHYKRWLVTADTGAAIKGALRGDVYFGFGDRAKRLAGAMQSKGTLTILLPIKQ